jgi:hypothetical protein
MMILTHPDDPWWLESDEIEVDLALIRLHEIPSGSLSSRFGSPIDMKGTCFCSTFGQYFFLGFHIPVLL